MILEFYLITSNQNNSIIKSYLGTTCVESLTPFSGSFIPLFKPHHCSKTRNLHIKQKLEIPPF